MGVNVRNRSKEIVVLLGDDQRIAEERKKARATRDKYTGLSSEQASFSRYGQSSSRYDSAFADEYALSPRPSNNR